MTVNMVASFSTTTTLSTTVLQWCSCTLHMTCAKKAILVSDWLSINCLTNQTLESFETTFFALVVAILIGYFGSTAYKYKLHC